MNSSELAPTRKVIASAIAAVVMGIINYFAESNPALGFLTDPQIASGVTALAMLLAAYFIRDQSSPSNRMLAAPMATVAAIGLSLLVLTGCASDSAVRWAQGQTLYNSTLQNLIDLRAPCVLGSGFPNAGPDNPQCVIDDAAYEKIETARVAADLVLQQVNAAANAGNAELVEALLAEFERLFEDLLMAKAEAEGAGG